MKWVSFIALLVGFYLVPSLSLADFTLTGDQSLVVNTAHNLGQLYDNSSAEIVYSGSVNEIDTHGSSSISFSYAYPGGGDIPSYGSAQKIRAYDSSNVDAKLSHLAQPGINRIDAYDHSTISASGTIDEIHSWNSAHLNIAGVFGITYAHDSSTVNVIGSGRSLYAYDTSTVIISQQGWIHIFAYGKSRIQAIAGPTGMLFAYDSSIIDVYNGAGEINVMDGTANVYGGNVGSLLAAGDGIANISGGGITNIRSLQNSTIILDGKNFGLGTGLTIAGNRVLGTGILSGQWMDGTSWSTQIISNDATANILVPEPGMLLLIGLGGISLRLRRSRHT